MLKGDVEGREGGDEDGTKVELVVVHDEAKAGEVGKGREACRVRNNPERGRDAGERHDEVDGSDEKSLIPKIGGRDALDVSADDDGECRPNGSADGAAHRAAGACEMDGVQSGMQPADEDEDEFGGFPEAMLEWIQHPRPILTNRARTYHWLWTKRCGERSRCGEQKESTMKR